MKIVTLIIATGLLAGAIFFVTYFSSAKEHAMPTHLNKVLSVSGWEASQQSGQLQLSSIDDTFIHLATDEQLDKVLEKFWGNESSYVIVKVDPKKFVGRLVHETNPGGVTKYYHLYNGHIPLAAVTDVRTVESIQCVK